MQLLFLECYRANGIIFQEMELNGNRSLSDNKNYSLQF